MALTGGAVTKKLVENLQADLRTLSAECKRKYPPVKEVTLLLFPSMSNGMDFAYSAVKIIITDKYLV